MAHVAALSQHIFSLEPDKDAARLAFYQYLKNLCDATEQVNAELINRFYLRALGFAHWQANKSQLFTETEMLLQHFQDSKGTALQLQGVLRDSDLQVIAVENLRNLELVVQKQLEANLTPYDKTRVLREGDSRVVAITLQGDRSLKITTYPRALILREGELQPLHTEFSLFYTGEISMHPMMIQQIEVGPHASARFHTGVEGLRGNFVRGYTFQKFASIDGGGLNRYPLLFYPLKRLEQFFVDRKSDPMYIELTSTLEKALDLLVPGASSDAYAFAQAALERGRLALDHIFPDDKLARLLITNLEKTLALAQTQLGSHRQATNPLAHHAQNSQPFAAPYVGGQGYAHEQATHDAWSHVRALDAEPEGIDLLKDEPWPEIKNLPV